MKDSSILEEEDFRLRVQSQGSSEALSFAIDNFHVLLNLQVSSIQLDAEFTVSAQSKRLRCLALLELERNNSHTDQIGSMDSFITLSDDDLDSLQVRSLCRPIS